jgi:hypothetical protein
MRNKRATRRPDGPGAFGDGTKAKQVKRLVTLSIGYAYLGKVDKVIDCQQQLSKVLKSA